MKPIDFKKTTVSELFSKYKQKYFLPLYQRDYAWTDEQCEALWDDLMFFFFPNNADFDRDSEYPLGSVTVYSNERNQYEIVDGQQRIQTLLLLIKALFDETSDMAAQFLGECLYYSNEMHALDVTKPKIEIESLTGEPASPLHNILLTGKTLKKDTDNYSKNFRFFQAKVTTLSGKELLLFSHRLLNNVYVILSHAFDEDDAMALFLTLNDRGMPLPVDKIFKAQLVKTAHLNGGNEAVEKIGKVWSELEEKSQEVFSFYKNVEPIKTLFWLYGLHHYIPINKLAEVKKVFGKNNYALLTKEETIPELAASVNFLLSLKSYSSEYSNSIYKKALFLWQSRNISWFSFLIDFFLKKRDTSNKVCSETLELILDRCIAYTVGLAASGGSLNALNKIRGLSNKTKSAILTGVLDEEARFSQSAIIDNLKKSHEFTSRQVRRRLLLSWWFLINSDIPVSVEKMQIEHIFSIKLASCRALVNPHCVELLGNLALLEQGINQKASNLSFADKRHYYLGNPPTVNEELKQLARNKNDFAEEEIIQRNDKITAAILTLLKRHDFLTD